MFPDETQIIREMSVQRLVDYLHRAVLWENLSVWCLWSLQTTLFSRKPSSPLLGYQLTAETRAVHARNSHFTCTASQVNQQVQLSFPSSLLYVYTTNLQVLFKLFFTARSLQVNNKREKNSDTHNHLLDTQRPTFLRLVNDTHTHTFSHAYCALCRSPVLPSGFPDASGGM